MLRSSYDVVIVGTDLPALVFGALAAKKGYRILVLGHGGRDNVYEVDGFRFVRRPNLLWGFADSNPIREVFRELALAPEMRNLPRPLQPTCNLVLPRSRVEVTHLKGVLEEEIEREFPESLDLFRDFARRLPEVEAALEGLLKECPVLPPGSIKEFFAYRRFRKAVEPLLGDDGTDALAPFANAPGLRAFFAAPLALMSGLAEPWRHPLPFLRVASHLMRGLYYVEWGLDALKSLFLERIRNNSGDVRIQDHADALVVKYGRVREVEIRARDEAIGTQLLVAGTHLPPVLDLVPDAQAKRRYRARVDRVEPSHWLVTMNVGMAREAIPEGMAQTAFVVRDPDRPFEGDNLIVVQADPAMEPADVLDRDKTVLSASALMPAARFDGHVASLEAFGQEILATLRTLVPFLDRHMTTLSMSSVTTNVKTGEPAVDVAGMIPVYPQDLPRGLDLVTWPVRTGYKNLLFLGDASSGALGFEGAFVSAYMAFAVLKKKIPLKTVM